RERPGHRAVYTHGNRWPHLFLSSVLALCVFFFIDMKIAHLSAQVWDELREKPSLGNTLHIQILAQQFAWNIQYAGPDGKFQTRDDIQTMNQLHIPVHRPIELEMQSKDVIHSFCLPNFRTKQDIVPGMTTRLWFEATETGQFEIACAELCGLGHYRMRGILTIQEKQDFDAWLKKKGSEKNVKKEEDE
ncbi:MAG: hypothetical protein HYS07_01960, partial [Chlamydiae bacterium]|nr:hypothetical protein [Chlamydiota bacterium]